MVGDSLVHWAGVRAKQVGCSLGVKGITVGWHGIRGMKWEGFDRQIQLLSLYNKAPRAVLIHLGGNDFCMTSQAKLMKKMKKCLKHLKSLFPGVRVVWVDVLQRRTWPGGNRVMEIKRRRINRAGRRIALWMFGDVLSLDIDLTTPGFYRNDGIHLSPVGVEMYLDGFRDKFGEIAALLNV